MTRPVLTLVTRRSCHLCEDFILDLEAHARYRTLTIEVVDADSDPELAARFGARVPVLLSGLSEICVGAFDAEALERHFASHGG